MAEQEKVVVGLNCCINDNCEECPYCDEATDDFECDGICRRKDMMHDALLMLEAQEQRHRLEVHNIGNVDIPEGVTEEQFHAVMSNVVDALEHTDKGESWPYDSERR